MHGSRALLLIALGGCQVVFPLADDPEPVECFTDRFDAATLQQPPWVGNNATVDNGTLVFLPPGGTVAGSVFDLGGASIELEIVEIPTSVTFSFVVSSGAISVEFGIANDAKLSAIAKMDGVTVDVAVVTYNSTTMRFFRLRDDSDGITFETSPDDDKWTTRGTSSLHLKDNMGITVMASASARVAIDNVVVRAVDCDGRRP